MTARDRLVILVVVAVAAVAAAWMLVIQPKRDQASKLGGQVQSEQSQLDSVRQQVAQNEAARSSFARNYASLARLGEAVPSTENVPSLIYEIQSASSGAKVDFRSLSTGTGGASGSSAPAAPAPTSSSTSGKSSTSSASGGAAGPTPEQFSFTFNGTFFQLSSLFDRIQGFVAPAGGGVSVSGRLISLGSVQFAAGPAGFPQITASITATAYILPPPQGSASGATSSGPAGSPAAPAPSTSGSAAAPAPAAAIGSPAR